MSIIVAIDGPAGSGKGTITQEISKKLGLINISTGNAYRAVSLECIRRGISIEEKEKIINILEEIKIDYKNKDGEDLIYLNNEDVTNILHQKNISQIVSQISSIKEVRFRLNEIFRENAKNKDIIMEGRDIGTYVFPNANVKIYLDATLEERVRRRIKQNKQNGIEMSENEVLENIKIRDENDKTKEVGALKQAEDAVYIDTTGVKIEDTVNKILKIIKEKTTDI